MARRSSPRRHPIALAVWSGMWGGNARRGARERMNYVNSIDVSQYADHGLLMRKAFASSGLTNLMETLQKKVSDSSSRIQDVVGVIQGLREEREKRMEKRLKVIAAAVALFGIVSLFCDAIKASNGYDDSGMWKGIVVALYLLSGIASLGACGLVLFLMRRGGSGRGRGVTQSKQKPEEGPPATGSSVGPTLESLPEP